MKQSEMNNKTARALQPVKQSVSHANRVYGAAKQAQDELLSEGNPAAAQSLNAILNLPVDSATRLFDIIRS